MSTGASVTTRWRARRRSETARAAMDRAPVVDDGGGTLQTSAVGIDPIRVLLFGSGPLIGYGVRARRNAVDGPLAEILAAQTGRGVIVETRVRLGLPINEAVRSLGAAGTTTFAAAVWAPRFGEELVRGDVERSRVSLHAMILEFRDSSSVPLVLCHLPVPLGHDWRSMLRRPRVATFNRLLTEEAASMPGIVAVDIGTYRPSVLTSTGSAWHRGVAEQLAPAVLRALGLPAAAPTPSGR